MARAEGRAERRAEHGCGLPAEPRDPPGGETVLLVAAHPHVEGRPLSQVNLGGDCCVVFGSEGHGISEKVLAACDEAVAIPMLNEVDSLNVSAAAAVFFYEVNRQRGQA